MQIEDAVLDYVSAKIDDFVYHELSPENIARAMKKQNIKYNPDWCISESTRRLENAMDILCDAVMKDLFYNK